MNEDTTDAELAETTADAGAPETPAADAPAEPPPPPPPTGIQTAEFWRDLLETPTWLFAGMKAGKGWPIGKELTREDYEAAAEWAANVPCR